MNVHNVMEEAVEIEIDRICESMEKEVKLGNTQYKGICTCAHCRLDAACYVLNRISPSYVVSGRGIIHAAQDSLEKQQKMTDISILVYEAMLQVAHNQRPGADHKLIKKKKPDAPEGFYFNIPVIYGRILHGATFAPMTNIQVHLFFEGRPVPMMNGNFSNPCKLNDKTKGIYTFWPAGVTASQYGEKKIFNYVLFSEAPEFESVRHSFVIPSESAGASVSFSMSHRFQLTDLYMFPKE